MRLSEIQDGMAGRLQAFGAKPQRLARRLWFGWRIGHGRRWLGHLGEAAQFLLEDFRTAFETHDLDALRGGRFAQTCHFATNLLASDASDFFFEDGCNIGQVEAPRLIAF